VLPHTYTVPDTAAEPLSGDRKQYQSDLKSTTHGKPPNTTTSTRVRDLPPCESNGSPLGTRGRYSSPGLAWLSVLRFSGFLQRWTRALQFTHQRQYYVRR